MIPAAIIREVAHQERRRKASRLPRASGPHRMPGIIIGAAIIAWPRELTDCAAPRIGALAVLADVVRL